jgi:hypothetical protein
MTGVPGMKELTNHDQICLLCHLELPSGDKICLLCHLELPSGWRDLFKFSRHRFLGVSNRRETQNDITLLYMT